MVENPGNTAEYVTNGHQWPSIPINEPYDSQLLPSGPEFKECVNCSTSQASYWRRENGHSLCNSCSYPRQNPALTRVTHRNQKAKQTTVRRTPPRQIVCLRAPKLHCNIEFRFRPLATDELVSFVQIVKQAVLRCGDETIKESPFAMHADCTTNYTRYVLTTK